MLTVVLGCKIVNVYGTHCQEHRKTFALLDAV